MSDNYGERTVQDGEYELHTMTDAEYARIKALAIRIGQGNTGDIFDNEDRDNEGSRLFDLLLPEVDDTDDWRVAAVDISDIAYEVAADLREEWA